MSAAALLTASLLTAGCRCNGDADEAEAPVDAEVEAPTRVETRARVQERRELVIADAGQLDDRDLATVEYLDLALSERDAQERPLPLPSSAESTTTADTGENGDADTGTDVDTDTGAPEPDTPEATSVSPRTSSPRCEGLDLHEVAKRAPRLKGLRISGCQAAVHAGLSAFGESLVELELVDLELDAVTVARLAQLHGLERLILTRVHAEPDALKPLGRKISPKSVTLRELADGSPVSEIFKILADIREIRLIGPWVDHETMIRVGKARRLERFAIIDTQISNFSLHQIKTLDHLHHLEWVGPGFNNQTLVTLRELPLDELICDCPRLGDKGLRQLYLLTGLRRLALERSDITSAGLAELGVLDQLTDLTIRYRDLDNAGFLALSTLPLQRLVLGPGKLEEAEAEGLGLLTGLRELDLDLEGFGDPAAAQLATLTALERLDLGGSEISDEGLVHLAGLTRMRELELHHTRVTKHGLEHLAGMRALEILELDHTDVVDDGIAHLVGLDSLRELRLDHTLITDAAIPYLLKLTALERLNLADTVVSAEGAAQLEQLPSLQAVNLQGTRALEPP